jgi:hypothetical protein
MGRDGDTRRSQAMDVRTASFNPQAQRRMSDSLPIGPGSGGAARSWGGVALLCIAAFLVTAVTLQFLRADLDWQRATLSRYLLGPYGLWLRIMYCALSLAIVVLAVGLYADLERRARSVAPLLLLATGAVALSAVAIGDSWLPERAPDLHRFVHGFAASSAFLLVGTGMLLQAWRFRGDAHWRRYFPLAFAWSLACYAVLWLHVLWPPAAGAQVQKALILMIVMALAAVAAGLWRREVRAAAPPGRQEAST